MVKITRGAFEDEFARRSLTTVEELAKLGQKAVPCTCDERGCRGWKMADVLGERPRG